MAKRKRRSNKKSDEKKHKEGRGLGNLDKYTPWLTIQDVASKGLATRIKGIKTGRVHHLLSRLELYCFYCLDWSERVLDIREQYPLDRQETIAIAETLGIKHPRVPVTGDQVVMTTDFLVTLQGHPTRLETAISVKYSNDLTKSRTMEKFEIERFYWERRGVKWSIFTERNVNRTLTRNIEWIHSFLDPGWLLNFIPSVLFADVQSFLAGSLFNSKIPLRRVTDAADEKFDLAPGVSMLIVRHLIATRKWRVDMTIPIQPEKPLCFIYSKSGA